MQRNKNTVYLYSASKDSNLHIVGIGFDCPQATRRYDSLVWRMALWGGVERAIQTKITREGSYALLDWKVLNLFADMLMLLWEELQITSRNALNAVK